MNHARTRRRGMRCGGRRAQNQYFYSRTHAGLRAPRPRGAARSVQRPAAAAVAAAPRASRRPAAALARCPSELENAAPRTGERRRGRIDAAAAALRAGAEKTGRPADGGAAVSTSRVMSGRRGERARARGFLAL